MVDIAQEAERLGYDAIFTAEAWGSDVFTPLTWIGAHTKTIRLGTGIAQLSARAPTATAMAALTLDHLSGGRVILGMGVSGPQVVEGWYGAPFSKPLSRTREYGADKTGSSISGNPLALASALEKIEMYSKNPLNVNPAVSQLFISDPLKSFTGSGLRKLFSTHPPTKERVRRLREEASGIRYR